MQTKQNKLLTFLRIILIIIVSIIIGLNIYNWNASRLLGDAMPMPSGYGMAVVLSGSMEPTLSIDDLIIVKKVDKYQMDDIVVYQKNNELIVHRIVSIDEENVITKGDANNSNDKEIPIKNIKGKVVNHIPYVGKIISFIKKPLGIFLVLGTSIFLYVCSNIKEKKQRKSELEELQEEINRLKSEK